MQSLFSKDFLEVKCGRWIPDNWVEVILVKFEDEIEKKILTVVFGFFSLSWFHSKEWKTF